MFKKMNTMENVTSGAPAPVDSSPIEKVMLFGVQTFNYAQKTRSSWFHPIANSGRSASKWEAIHLFEELKEDFAAGTIRDADKYWMNLSKWNRRIREMRYEGEHIIAEIQWRRRIFRGNTLTVRSFITT